MSNHTHFPYRPWTTDADQGGAIKTPTDQEIADRLMLDKQRGMKSAPILTADEVRRIVREVIREELIRYGVVADMGSER